MTTPEKNARALLEAIQELTTERERLFQLIAALANLLDRQVVIEIVGSFLGIDPVEQGDCVVFDDIAIRFGADNRVKSVYQTFDGTDRQ